MTNFYSNYFRYREHFRSLEQWSIPDVALEHLLLVNPESLWSETKPPGRQLT